MNWLKEKLKGWKTVAFNALVVIPPILDVLGAADLKAILGPEWFAYYSVFAGLVNLYLRTITHTAVGKNK